MWLTCLALLVWSLLPACSVSIVWLQWLDEVSLGVVPFYAWGDYSLHASCGLMPMACSGRVLDFTLANIHVDCYSCTPCVRVGIAYWWKSTTFALVG